MRTILEGAVVSWDLSRTSIIIMIDKIDRNDQCSGGCCEPGK